MADECETKRVLAKALERLQDVAVKDLDFDYSDAKAALEREDNTLKGENRELRRQVDSLEGKSVHGASHLPPPCFIRPSAVPRLRQASAINSLRFSEIERSTSGRRGSSSWE